MKLSFRAFLALILCKLLRAVSRLLHRGGTAMPGRFAMKVCPDLLSRLSGGVKTVAVTGTNGKTTCSRMMEEAFAEAGLNYFANRSGANLMSGITTEFVMNCTLSGRMKKEYAVIECDEAAATKVFQQLKPKVIVVTNLFRDQLDRYGEITHTLSNIRQGIGDAPEAVLCLNADCSLTASLADDGLPNQILWYGVNASAGLKAVPSALSDASHCIHCKAEYEYDYHTYAHLGGFRCPRCGYRRHRADYAVTDVIEQRPDGSDIVMDLGCESAVVTVNLPAMYNIYNAAGAVAAVTEMGLGAHAAVDALAKFQCGFGRMERFDLAGGTRMMLVKNPVGCNQVIEYLQTMREKFVLVICLNDRAADGRDISWIWDADFEGLNALAGRLDEVIVSGDRAEDMRVRIKYAGVDDAFIRVERDYETLVRTLAKETRPVCMMPTYTAMLELRQTVIRHCGGEDFWE